jgi:hypothetical protein
MWKTSAGKDENHSEASHGSEDSALEEATRTACPLQIQQRITSSPEIPLPVQT